MKSKLGEKFLSRNSEKQFLAMHETIEFIKEKTSLDDKSVKLLIDAFNFLIRRVVVDHGKLHIWTLGTFYVRNESFLKGKVRIFFNACDDFKEYLKGERKLTFFIKHSVWFEQKFKQMGEIFGIEFKDVKFLFSLYTYAMITNLVKYGEFRIIGLGCFYFIDKPLLKTTPISIKYGGNVNTKILRFKASPTAKEEIFRKRKTISVSKRLKRMFYFSNVDTEIQPMTYDINQAKNWMTHNKKLTEDV